MEYYIEIARPHNLNLDNFEFTEISNCGNFELHWIPPTTTFENLRKLKIQANLLNLHLEIITNQI